MANATVVKTCQIYWKGEYLFDTSNGKIWVQSFTNGTAVFEPSGGDRIYEIAEIAAGCFNRDSNVEILLQSTFSVKEKLQTVEFEFNGEIVKVTAENADEEAIVSEYHRLLDLSYQRYLKEQEEYKKTPEYRAERTKKLKTEMRNQAVAEKVRAVDKTTEIEFMNEEAQKNWNVFVTNNNDVYGVACVNYARRWAKYMQMVMKRDNKSICQIAKQTSYACDVNGITGFMYGCAVSALSQWWKYGEELNKWHNKE